MSTGARIFFASGLSLLLGAAAGAYVTSVVYGDTTEPIDPGAHRERSCPPCRECPACPPPIECGETGVVPTSTAPRALHVPEGEELDRDRRAGLPASAIQAASQYVREGFTTCYEEARRIDARGTVLLDLTVTATGGQAFISDANVIERSDDATATGTIEACLIDRARETRFAVDADDGEARFRLPVRIRKE